MKKPESKMIVPKLDDLFTTQEQRDYENAEKVVYIDRLYAISWNDNNKCTCL